MSVKAISPERVQSNVLLRDWCQHVRGSVLSIGAGGDIDKEGRTYRSYFSQASQYTTSDVVPGCDRVLDARDMPSIPGESFDGVFCSGVLEHVDDYRLVARECWRILKPAGTFIVGVPFKQPIHRAPGDYWRFTEYGLRYLLKEFDIRDVVPIGDPAFPFGYWARARKRV